MVPEGIKFALFSTRGLPVSFIPKGAIFKKECKKVLFNSFFSLANFISLQQSKKICQKINCALSNELIFLYNFVLPLFFTVKK